jgi:hypothetical protein
MFFEKIVLCSEDEKKENLQQARKEFELILQQEKIESRKKEIMHSISSVNLPKDKFLSKTGNRNSQPYYGSVRESLSPRHKSYSLSLSEKIQQQEKEQFIDEVIQKLNIPLLLAEFKKDFKQSLLGLLGREIKIFEKRPFLTCKDHLIAYLAMHEDVQIKDIQGFMDKLNDIISDHAKLKTLNINDLENLVDTYINHANDICSHILSLDPNLCENCICKDLHNL